jgi:tRNA pseudouridine38-40 synthase
MPRYALLIEYDGGPFCGWQRQNGQASVQAALETALARLDPAAPTVTGAGRTDAGVHASGQVAHADLTRNWDGFRLTEALNFHLKPLPIAVLAAEQVRDEFHARFSASWRLYRYAIFARRAPLTTDLGRAWRVPGPLDVTAMRAGAEFLIGQHDFTTFRSSLCQAKSPAKTLDGISIGETPAAAGQRIALRFRARSFLHNQVRSMVGTLERVGSGAWAPTRVAEALAARDRSACGPVAPPEGLTLLRVGYLDDPFRETFASESQED